MNATEIITALRVHYGDGYRLVEQVADHTGFRASRWLDAMAFGLWPSRGLEIHGIEVKTSRADFRREMELPAKAEATAARCDRFYIAAPAGLVDPLYLETLAPAWGLLEVTDGKNGRRVRTTKTAARTEQAKPVDRDFLAAVLRRIPGVTDEIRAEIRAEVEAANEQKIAEAIERGLARNSNSYINLRDRVAAFETASGISMAEFTFSGNVESFGRAVRLLIDEIGGWESARTRLRHVAESARSQGQGSIVAADRVVELVSELDDLFGRRP